MLRSVDMRFMSTALRFYSQSRNVTTSTLVLSKDEPKIFTVKAKIAEKDLDYRVPQIVKYVSKGQKVEILFKHVRESTKDNVENHMKYMMTRIEEQSKEMEIKVKFRKLPKVLTVEKSVT
ncbi:uncharacterized protein LOC143461301 [Clavelina lepadiformis]|uniref:Uncharacterized protein n=1 Tax=Clavelina lepadiformis TaxID=159417 RepID=A0ABP0F844_CLALP